MPTTRSRKRAASTEAVDDSTVTAKKSRQSKNSKADAEPEVSGDEQPASDVIKKDLPPKKTRQTKKTKAEVEPEASGDDQPAPDVKKDSPAKKTGKKIAATSTKAATATKAKGKKGKKAKDEDVEDDGKSDDVDSGAVENEVKTEEPKEKGKAKALEELEAGERSTQFAKAKDLFIPVDKELNLPNQMMVFIDVDNDRTIFDASLNQTNASGNNNKFYKIQLVTNGMGGFWTWTRWGRVGENGQREVLGQGDLISAKMAFERKFKDKTGLRWADRMDDPKAKKYVFLERTYEAESDNDADGTGLKAEEDEPEPESKLVPEVQSLMKFIFNQEYIKGTMADMNYDANKLPLGKLSKSTILRGYQTLKDLAALLADQSLATSVYDTDYKGAVEALSNRFYSYIPHAFGRNRPPTIDTMDLLKNEVQLLESLTELKDVDAIMKTEKGKKVNMLDAQYSGLGMREMTPVDPNSAEFSNIHEYLFKTRGQTHALNYKLLDVFRLERDGENDRFKTITEDKSDRRLLWHGSRSTNFGGILSQGLRIAPPEAPVSGYMFGKGVYLADMSSKSANYCCHYISNDEALLLLCEAELGTPMQELTDASYSAGEDAAAKSMLSTWGKGIYGPKAWKDAECIHADLKGVKMPDTTEDPAETKVDNAYLYYNEYICYDITQIRLRYLLRVKM